MHEDLRKRYLCCTPCFKGRNYDEKTDLYESAIPIAAATYNELLLKASPVVSH